LPLLNEGKALLDKVFAKQNEVLSDVAVVVNCGALQAAYAVDPT
jgi:hypothetical protein